MQNNDITHSKALQRKIIQVQGQVQGVGFRPFVYRLALQHKLNGTVRNNSQGVCIEVQGAADNIRKFIEDFHATLPPLAKLNACEINIAKPKLELEDFQILSSHAQGGHEVLISPDTSICSECKQDIFEQGNLRYHYPFTNCTNCGPRYTITHSIPYDRATTSMACFKLCPHCHSEYDNPLNRRFHAQPNACPVCGPQVWYVQQGAKDTSLDNSILQSDAALKALAKDLKKGLLVAIKGLGGFHLSCDASNENSIALLRKLKKRPHKPLAIMVLDLNMARRIAHISTEEEKLLSSHERPIVLCSKRHNVLPNLIAPQINNVGIVLPYTPLHLILMQHFTSLCSTQDIVALVMTSGNAGGEPICLGNREALAKLHFVQGFLLHNRDILVRTDDSVCTTAKDIANIKPRAEQIFFRRARGYVPRPIKLANIPTKHAIMGMGAELKSTLCLSREHMAFVSQHVGDLQNVETLAFYHEVLAHLEMLLEVRATALVHDLHPNFMSTQVAKEVAKKRDIPCLSLQHHFAHAWSVLAEHKFEGKVLALTLDGTGLGLDKSIWGGELLQIDTVSLEHKRIGCLSPFALAGGDAATREPWRIALALAKNSPWQEYIVKSHANQAQVVLEMLERNINSLPCSSVGRLFDAVSAGLGLCTHTSYEGQAAICLENAQNNLSWQGAGSLQNSYICKPKKALLDNPHSLQLEQDELWQLSSRDLFLAALAEKDVALAARRFHTSLAQGFAHMAKYAAQEQNIWNIALCGGAMQNATLHSILIYLLEQMGFNVLLPRDLPSNDGGISLGQVAWAMRALRACP